MKETEVLKRLGIRGKNELISLQQFSDILGCIWLKGNYYELTPKIPHLIDKIEFLNSSDGFHPIDINKKITLNYNRKDIGNLQRKNRYVGWKVKFPRQALLKEDLSDYYTTNDGIPHNNIVHRGHLLGKQFKKFLFDSTSLKNDTIHFLIKITLTIYINNLVEQIAMISLIMVSYILKKLLVELSKTILVSGFTRAAIMKLKQSF